MTRLNQVLALDDVLAILVEEGWELHNNSQVTIQLVQESGWVETVVGSNMDITMCGMSFPPGKGIVGKALHEQRLINVGDVLQSDDFIPGQDCYGDFRSLMVVPLMHNNESIGAMSLTADKVDAFSDLDQDKFLRLAQYASHAVAHAMIYERLQREEKKYRVLVEKSLQGILVFDGDDIVYANPAATALYGDMSGLTIYDLLRNGTIQTVGGRKVFIQPEMIGKFEVVVKGCDGGTRWLEVQIIRLDNEVIQVIFLDVTARVEMSRLQERAIKEKEATLRLQGTAIGRYTEIMEIVISALVGITNGEPH